MIRSTVSLPKLRNSLRPVNGLKVLPKVSLLSYIKNYNPATAKITDTVGANERILYPLQFGQWTANETMTGTVGAGVTVVSKSGDATVTVTNTTTLTMGAGSLWSLILSNGSRYEHPTKTGAASAMWFDVSGNGRHLICAVSNVDTHCASGWTSGSDWLNQKGWTLTYGSSASVLLSYQVVGTTYTFQFYATKVDSAILGDVQVYGPLYVRTGYLVAKDGTNEAVVATTWAAGVTVTAVVEVFNDGVRDLVRVTRGGV